MIPVSPRFDCTNFAVSIMGVAINFQEVTSRMIIVTVKVVRRMNHKVIRRVVFNIALSSKNSVKASPSSYVPSHEVYIIMDL